MSVRSARKFNVCQFITPGAPLTSCSMDAQVLFVRVKQSGRDDDHSTPLSAEVKDEWSCTSAVAIRLRSVAKGNPFTVSINFLLCIKKGQRNITAC